MSTVYAAKGTCPQNEKLKDGFCISETLYKKPCIMEDMINSRYAKCSSLMTSEPIYTCKGKNDALWGNICRTPARPITSIADAMNEAWVPPS